MMKKNIFSAMTALMLCLMFFGEFLTIQPKAENSYSYDYSSNFESSFSESSEESRYQKSEPETSIYDSDIAEPTPNPDYSGSDFQKAILNNIFYRDESVYFADEAGVFMAIDRIYIRDMLIETSKSTGMNIALFIGGNYRDDPLTESFTIEALKEIFGNDPYTNSIMLYLDFEGHSPSYDFIRTQHDASLYISGKEGEGRIGDILSDMYDFLPKSGETVYRSKVKSAVSAFCKDIDNYVNESGAIERKYYYNEELGRYRFAFYGNIIETSYRPYRYPEFFLFIGLFVSFITALITSYSIKRRYKFRVTQDTSVYTSKERIHMNFQQDIFLGEHTSRTRIESSDSGGGSSGGGGGGGGSFDGGGGHR